MPNTRPGCEVNKIQIWDLGRKPWIGQKAQRNKENNILEILGQALRKQKICRKKIFQNSFLSHPKFQDLEKKKTKKKNQKNQYFRILSGDAPNSKTSGKLFFCFLFFLVFCRFLSRGLKYCFLFFWFSTGFLVFFIRACPGTSRIMFSLFLFDFLQGYFNFLSQGIPCWCSGELLD